MPKFGPTASPFFSGPKRPSMEISVFIRAPLTRSGGPPGSGLIDRRVLHELEAMIGSLRPGRVLDVACGTGPPHPASTREVAGIDQSARMLDIARERLPDARLVRETRSTFRSRTVRSTASSPAISTDTCRAPQRAGFLDEACRVVQGSWGSWSFGMSLAVLR